MDGATATWIVLIVTSGVVGSLRIVFGSGRRREIAPEQLLKKRFANGEIGEEEYVRRLAVLQHDRLLELDD
jgi:uncharacterized membrane protein